MKCEAMSQAIRVTRYCLICLPSQLGLGHGMAVSAKDSANPYHDLICGIFDKRHFRLAPMHAHRVFRNKRVPKAGVKYNCS